MALICYLRAFIDYLRSGVYVPHLFTEVGREENKIIFSTDSSFRVSENYNHLPNEKLHLNSTVITCKCKYCGKLMYEWFSGKEEDIPTI